MTRAFLNSVAICLPRIFPSFVVCVSNCYVNMTFRRLENYNFVMRHSDL